MDVNEYNETFLKEKKLRSKTLCPRCGLVKLNQKTENNAISKHEDGIFICSECGVDEAMLEYVNKPLPLEKWAVTRWEKRLLDA